MENEPQPNPLHDMKTKQQGYRLIIVLAGLVLALFVGWIDYFLNYYKP